MTGLEIVGAATVIAVVTAAGTWLDRRLRSDPDAPRFRHRPGETAETAIVVARTADLEKLQRGRCRCGRRCAGAAAEVRLGDKTVIAMSYGCGRCGRARTRYFRLGRR